MDKSSKIFGLILGPILFALILCISPPEIFSSEGWAVIAVCAFMIVWWITEAIPISVTAFLPIILLPVLDVTPLKEVTMDYGHPVVFLFIGGFVVAVAMEKYNLHKRIALSILKLTGSDANGVVFGFMLSSAFMSMWMPNTAAAALMLPIGLAIREVLFSDISQFPEKRQRYFTITMMLCIAYGANIGGTATLIGTPPNAILAAFVSEQFGITVTFWKWLLIGFPFASLLMVLGWAVLTFVAYPNRMGRIENASNLIKQELKKLGPLQHHEKFTILIFVFMISLWMFKSFLPFEIHDAAIAMTAAILCFGLPVCLKNQNLFLLNRDDLPRLPWAILFLFGGVVALGNAIQDTGLSDLITQSLSTPQQFHSFAFIVIALLVVLMMTEILGNIPVILIMLPVLTGAAAAFNLEPLVVLVPATLAASCAFMLPTATPPNAVVFSCGHLRVFDMIRAGILMNALAIFILGVLAWFWFPVVLDAGALN